MRPFEEEFNHLNAALQEMGALVAHSIHRAVISLVERNQDFAHQVIRDEARIDQLEINIDDMATSLIAREQPVARDMRFLVAAIKINSDLERMGDLALSIAERSLVLMHQPAVVTGTPIMEVANTVESMVLGCLSSFVKRDVVVAGEIIAADDAVDKLRNAYTAQVLQFMQQDPSAVERALDYILIARALERIADHAANIAKDIIFLVQGVNIRHQSAVQAA